MIKKNNEVFVFDTKYKELDSFEKIKHDKSKLGVSTEDLRQMAVYASKRKAKRLCLIYPLHRGEEIETDDVTLNIELSNDGTSVFPCDIKKVPFIFDGDIEKTKVELRELLMSSLK